MNFLELTDWYIDYHRNPPKIDDRRDPDTIRKYKNQASCVADYLLIHDLIDLNPEQFDEELADKIFSHMLCQGYKRNYAVRCVIMCKAILKWAKRRKLIQNNHLSDYSLKKEKAGKPPHLTPAEVMKIVESNPLLPGLSKAKDMAIFQCLTGMDYGDLSSVNRSHLTNYKEYELLIKCRKKTGVEAIIPITDAVKSLLRKYNYNMALLTLQAYNRNLKGLMALLGIDKYVTSHRLRKTYGMIEMNYNNTGLAALSKRLGHKYVSTTEEYYAQPDIMAVINDLERKERG